MIRPAVSAVLAVAVLAAAGAGWRYFAAPVPTDRLSPDAPGIVATGRDIYLAHCASCHGAKLRGQPDWQMPDADGRLPAPPHDASGHTWHHDDATLIALVRQGTAAYLDDPDYDTAMPGFGDVLSDEQIVAVLSYIKSTWPAETRAIHDTINARAVN